MAVKLRTSGVVARELGEPLHRVEYVLKTRPEIVPSARAGRLRLFSAAAVSRIQNELERIDARRAGKGGAS